MADYDLPLSVDYVKHWGVVEAVREIWQNALDQEAVNGQPMRWERDGTTLRVISPYAILEKSSLLLGHTTKAADDKLIGNFGEGYKLAALVLSREGHRLKIKNHAKREIWTPRIKNSRKFDAQILAVNVEKHYFKEPGSGDLVFEIGGIDDEIMYDLQEANLWFNDYPKNISTTWGNILLDVELAGKVFVNGLLVGDTREDSQQFGYDLKPQHVSLDRDRGMIRGFDLYWKTSQMWLALANDHQERFMDLLKREAADVRYASDHTWCNEKAAAIAYMEFVNEHGEEAYPCNTQEEIEAIKKVMPTVKTVHVGGSYAGLLHSTGRFKSRRQMTEPDDRPIVIPKDELTKFRRKFRERLGTAALQELDRIIDLSTNWRDRREE